MASRVGALAPFPLRGAFALPRAALTPEELEAREIRRRLVFEAIFGTRGRLGGQATSDQTRPADGGPPPPQTRSTKATQGRSVDLQGEGYLRLREVLLVFPVSRSAWYAGVKGGMYPQPVALGKRAKGYRISDIRKLVEQSDGGVKK